MTTPSSSGFTDGAYGHLPTTTAEEAHPAETRFRVEIFDGGQWMPAGMPTQHRQIALDALAARRAVAKTWAADGEPVRWRVVRETTTYTVEAES